MPGSQTPATIDGEYKSPPSDLDLTVADRSLTTSDLDLTVADSSLSTSDLDISVADSSLTTFDLDVTVADRSLTTPPNPPFTRGGKRSDVITRLFN
jgi:hypothetical protein